MSPSSIPRTIAIALVSFLFLANLYRARTQSITCDEAFTHQLFLVPPASVMFTTYDANHHILHTFLCRISVSLFGLSEFTLRLPSLLGGLIYFLVVYRLSRYLFGDTWTFLLAVEALTLNPLLLDLLSAARGYGLGLAFCLWAFYHILRYLARPDERSSLFKAAAGLALSVASNLTFLLPDAGLAILLIVVFLADGSRSGGRKLLAERASLLAQCFYVPAVLIAFPLIALPLAKAQRDHFYYGSRSLAETVDSLVSLSLFHHPTLWGIAKYYSILMICISAVAKWIVPAVLLLAGLAWIEIARGWIRAKSFQSLGRIDQFLFLSAGAAFLALGLSVAGHRATGLLYPISRTGLYWIVFFVLISLGLARKWVLLRAPLLLFLGLCTAWFAFEFNTNQYTEWRYDAGTKRIVHLLEAKHAVQGGGTTRVGVSWLLEPSMNFYRRLDRLDWLEPVDIRRGTAGLDYFVLVWPDTDLVEKLQLAPLYKDPVSGQVLARAAR